ncbi:unnamed protein product, partial [Cuscuta epithymum]
MTKRSSLLGKGEKDIYSCLLEKTIVSVLVMELLRPGLEGGAEAVLKLQPNTFLSVAYHPLFGPHDDLMLLELDENLLPEFLHQSVTLRGQPNEDAVLCTQSKTYALKFVGTSNSVLLI